MSYLKQDQLPKVCKKKIGFGYSAIAVSEGGCTIAVYKDRHVYFFPTYSPSIASHTFKVPLKHHELDPNNQLCVCKNGDRCHLLSKIESNDTQNDTEESLKKTNISSDNLSVNYIKFSLSNQFLLLAGPETLCLHNLEEDFTLYIDLFQSYNGASKCINDTLVDISSNKLASIDLLCYRNSVNFNNKMYQIIDIIASYQPQKPVFMRIYFDKASYFIDCSCSYRFNDYLLNLHKEICKKESITNNGEPSDGDRFYSIFYSKSEPKVSNLGHPCTPNYTFPAATLLIHETRNSRLIHQAMLLKSITMQEFSKIEFYESLFKEFTLAYFANIAFVVGPRYICIMSIRYECLGNFISLSGGLVQYRCIRPPDFICTNVEFLVIPWKNCLPRQMYAHPKVEMFAALFYDRFFILANESISEIPTRTSSQVCSPSNSAIINYDSKIDTRGKRWVIKYHFIDQITKQKCFFGTFSGEPLNNYFLCSWKSTFSNQLAFYDNNAETGISAKRLVLSVSKFKGLIQLVWVPNYRIIVGIGGLAGELVYISPKEQMNWAQMIPDFVSIQHNVEYLEGEDEFDQQSEEQALGNYQYGLKELWNMPWEPVTHKLGTYNFKFYTPDHIFNSQSLSDPSSDTLNSKNEFKFDSEFKILIDDKELPADVFTS